MKLIILLSFLFQIRMILLHIAERKVFGYGMENEYFHKKQVSTL